MQSPASSTICGTPGARKNARPYLEICTGTSGINGPQWRTRPYSVRRSGSLPSYRRTTRNYSWNVPDDSDILVCKECGSRQLEIQAWINANTDERIRYVHDDNNGLWCDGKWCEECGVQVFFCTKAEFTQKMQGWWESCGFETKEQITGLKVCDSPPSENTQTFIDAADQWWNSRDYEHKREIYNRYNSKNE